LPPTRWERRGWSSPLLDGFQKTVLGMTEAPGVQDPVRWDQQSLRRSRPSDLWDLSGHSVACFGHIRACKGRAGKTGRREAPPCPKLAGSLDVTSLGP